MKYRIKSLHQQFFDLSVERKNIAANVRRTRARLDRAQILTGLCVFVSATGVIPPIEDIKQCLSRHTQPTPLQANRLTHADLQSLL